jgi:hypothetical protein
MKRKTRIKPLKPACPIEEQYLLFHKQLESLCIDMTNNVLNDKAIDSDIVKELIYTARQFINRHNKLKKMRANA